MARKKVVPEYGTIMKRGIQYYRTRMQDADGKWISLYAQTPEELYDKSIEMKRSIENEIFRKNNPTVAEYCEKWLKMRSASVRENTLSGYERTIRKYIIGAIGDMYMDEVTTDDLRLLLVPISKQSASLYSKMNMLIKCVFYSAEESKIISYNPAASLSAKGGTPKQEKKALTDEQVKILLDTIRGLPPYVFVMIGLYAGLRREEILGLQWDCVFLDEKTPYDSDPSKATDFMEHLRRSFHYTIDHLGPHKLPLIGRADWNDCLNLNCFSTEPGESFQTFGPSEGPNAESVFIAGMFVRYGKDYVEICRHRGLEDEAKLAEDAIAEMEKTVLNAGWDGEWFLRAYDHYKNKIGSKECEDGKIFIEPQGFCVMAEIGLKEGNCLKAMESVEKYLDTKYGIVLLQPPYHRYHVELGEISSYPPGYKENAGIFCHNNPWISIAETVVGRGNRAWQVYTRTCPAYIEDISEIHRTEPYVYSQMIAGKDAPNFGEAKNSWLTGTAAWTFLDVSQYILGIRPDYDGLTVDPCIPSTLDGFEAKRDFRGVTYHISVRNPKHVEKGVASMTVDGVAVDGNMIPLPTGKTEVSVEVVMG